MTTKKIITQRNINNQHPLSIETSLVKSCFEGSDGPLSTMRVFIVRITLVNNICQKESNS